MKVPGDARPDGTFRCGQCEDFRNGVQGDTTLKFENRAGIVADIAGREFFLLIWGEKEKPTFKPRRQPQSPPQPALALLP